MGLLTGAAALIMRPPEEWRYSYLISWVAGLMALGIVSLLISWLGRRQQQQATTDALTGIANRHLLAELLERHHERATTQQRGYALMLIDIDRFKTINDTLGHAIGDRVLADVAALIVRNLRRTDHVGRWGGDEFLVLLVDADLRRAQEIAERIRTATERRVPADGARPTLSIGVHCYRAGQSIEQVLACADEALYQAKYAGRNQVGLWVPR
jgi:diguanylate cyclase (GGDEF)-like protein